MKGLLFTYALSYGGAAVSIFNPFIGLLIYVSFAIIKPDDLWFWSVPRGNYSRIVAVALLAGWAYQTMAGRLTDRGPSRGFGRGRAVAGALVSFWAWSCLGAALAREPGVAMAFVEQLTKIVLPYLVGMSTIRTQRQLKQLAWVIFLSQAYVAFELNLSYLEGYNRLLEDGFGGMDNNSYAISLVTCAAVGFYLGLYAKAPWQRAIAFAGTGMILHAVLISFSRGGMLSICISFMVAFLITPKRPNDYLIFAVLTALIIVAAGPEVRERFVSSFAGGEERDASAQSRLDLWGACWDSMLKRPILGVGPDHWPLIVHEYGWPKGKEAHTLWLQIGAEQGFTGMFLILSFYGICVVRLVPVARADEAVVGRWRAHAARMVVASLCGFAVAAQCVSLEFLEAPYYVNLIGAGLLKLSSHEDEDEDAASGSFHYGRARWA